MKARERRDDQPAGQPPVGATGSRPDAHRPDVERVARGRASDAGWKVAAIAVAALLVGVVAFAAPPPSASPVTGAASPAGAVPTPVVPRATASTTPATPAPASPGADGRYDDGIPAAIDGVVVLRVPTVAAGSERPLRRGFFVGGWSNGACRGADATPGATTTRCSELRLSDVPAGGVTGRLRFEAEPGVVIPAGPVVVRAELVRRYCPGPDRCVSTISVEEVVWSGDVATDARPIAVHVALEAIRERFPVLRLSPYRELPTCDAEWPSQVYWAPTDPAVRIVAVFPTTRARVEAEVSTRTAGAPLEPGEEGCILARDRSVTQGTSWVAVANVLVLADDAGAADAAVVETLRRALERIRGSAAAVSSSGPPFPTAWPSRRAAGAP